MWRAATATDDDAVVALTRALYEEDPAPRPVPSTHVRRTLERLRQEPTRGRTMVLEIEGAVRGYAFVISFWSNELGGEICVVDEIYVAHDVRGLGHGSVLIDSLAKAGPVALELEVSPENERARALYERLGFTAKRNTTLRRDRS